MKSAPFWILLNLAVFLGVVNFAAWQQERVYQSGEQILLELAPVDPRSLIQGDYMVLNYQLTTDLLRARHDRAGGKAILTVDENGVARFARFDNQLPLAPGEVRIRYESRGSPRLGIEHYFFQEGLAERFEAAQYALVYVRGDGALFLSGLADAARNPL